MSCRGALLCLCLVSCAGSAAPRHSLSTNDYLAYICCRDERISICIGPSGLVEDDSWHCTIRHERVHVEWLRERHPDCCDGLSGGHPVPAYNLPIEEIRRSECTAYEREALCLFEINRRYQALRVLQIAEKYYNCSELDG